jgi:iron(III) transport system permease protein
MSTLPLLLPRWRWVKPSLTSWFAFVFLLSLVGLVAIPVLVVVSRLFVEPAESWQHLWDTVLGDYVSNTLWLVLGVAVGVMLIGVSTAWLVAMCDFWGRRLLECLLILPLAAPAYLVAYIYTDFLEYYGLLQRGLRAMFGWQSASDYWFPPVRHLWGAIAMMTLVLYPYVYLLARVAFLAQSACILEASRILGCSPWRSFWRIALPLARPVIAGGVALAVMEVLNDYGTVQYFGVPTFTVGVYRTWFGLGDQPAAMQLAALLALVALGIIVAEQWSRGRSRFHETTGRPVARFRLGWGRGSLAFLTCALPVLLGFVLPLCLIIYMCLSQSKPLLDDDFWSLAQNSLTLAGIAAGIGSAIALVLAYLQRHFPFMQVAVRLSAMGYGIPGAVIAVGIMVPFGWADQQLNQWLGTGLILSGSAIALIYAYNIRFLAVALNSVESSLHKVKPHLDEASSSLGQGLWGTLWRIHTPLVRGGVLAGMVFLFVDTLKELPATIIMRPFNFDTLAVRVFQYASDERLYEAAAPALAILLLGLVPVALMSWQISRSYRQKQGEL